jgi:uncharacterized protein YbjQ (UPF0145 family)
VIITTTETIVGKKIVRTLGLVKGNTVRATHMGHDIAAFFRNIVGGEVNDYTKLLAEAREQSLDRLVEDGLKVGANAIVGCRFSTCEMMRGAAEIIVYGTAVVVEEE